MRPLQSHGRNLKPSQMRRGRPGLPYIILSTLLYGSNSSVEKLGEGRCVIATTRFSKTLGCKNSYLIKACEWLKKHKLLIEMDREPGVIRCQVRSPWNLNVPGGQERCWVTSVVDNVGEDVQDDG
jgi:hypothetical protein